MRENGVSNFILAPISSITAIPSYLLSLSFIHKPSVMTVKT